MKSAQVCNDSKCYCRSCSNEYSLLGYSDLGHSKVILDNGRYAGGVRRDGSFHMCVIISPEDLSMKLISLFRPEVDEGSYILSVVSHDYAFDNVGYNIAVHRADVLTLMC